jgi:hypothetical protein
MGFAFTRWVSPGEFYFGGIHRRIQFEEFYRLVIKTKREQKALLRFFLFPFVGFYNLG